MRFTPILLIGAALLLGGCSTVRSAFGELNETIEKNQAGQEVAAPDAAMPDGTPAAEVADAGTAPTGTGPVVIENIKKAAKRVPDTLVGDTANAAHLGEPIPPQ